MYCNFLLWIKKQLTWQFKNKSKHGLFVTKNNIIMFLIKLISTKILSIMKLKSYFNNKKNFLRNYMSICNKKKLKNLTYNYQV